MSRKPKTIEERFERLSLHVETARTVETYVPLVIKFVRELVKEHRVLPPGLFQTYLIRYFGSHVYPAGRVIHAVFVGDSLMLKCEKRTTQLFEQAFELFTIHQWKEVIARNAAGEPGLFARTEGAFAVLNELTSE